MVSAIEDYKITVSPDEYHMDFIVHDENNEVFMEGSIKWDGCMNVLFGDGESYLHFCEVDAVLEYHQLLSILVNEHAPKSILRWCP